MQLFFPSFSANVYRVQVLSDKGRQPLAGRKQTIAQGLISQVGQKEGKGLRVGGELVICWKQPAHSQISKIRKKDLKVEMETRYEERTEQIRRGWQGKSVRYQENLFCPTIL